MLHLKALPHWLQLLAMVAAAWHTHIQTNTHTYIHSFVLFKGILLWERGEEVERYQRGKLYNILSSLFVNTAVYGVFKCACTLKQTKLRVRTGVS